MPTVDVDGLSDAVMEQLKQYSIATQKEINAAAKEVGKACAKQLRRTSPKGQGEYAKGWTSTVAYESLDDVRVVVHNKAKPQIVHLLEHGHAKVNGGRVPGIPHVAPAEENAAESFTRKVEEALSQV